eukprot:SAG31_NODE_20594_length_570_cov_0.673036_2_plen_49_part_01
MVHQTGWTLTRKRRGLLFSLQGEATSLAHAGRIGELLEEAIHRHKIIFV